MPTTTWSAVTERPLIDAAFDAGVGVLLGSPQMLGILAAGDPQATARRRDYSQHFTPGDIDRAADWWHWCREREAELRHLNIRFVLANPGVSAVLTGAPTPSQVESNVREAHTRVPDDVWAEALARVAETDGQHGEPA